MKCVGDGRFLVVYLRDVYVWAVVFCVDSDGNKEILALGLLRELLHAGVITETDVDDTPINAFVMSSFGSPRFLSQLGCDVLKI